jgi:hypothetical protein
MRNREFSPSCGYDQLTLLCVTDYPHNAGTTDSVFLGNVGHGVLLTYAGSPAVAKAMYGKLCKLNSYSSLEEVQRGLETSLAELSVEAISSTDMLCAVSIAGGSFGLFKMSGHVVHLVDGGWDFIGSGDSSLIRYLASFFPPRPLSMRAALIAGAYIVQQAKTFIDGCGGDTDICVLLGDGRCSAAWRDTIEATEEQGDHINTSIRKVFSYLLSDNPKQARMNWEGLSQKIVSILGMDKEGK